jgi:hypothetical protein
MTIGDPGQALELSLAVLPKFAFENAPCGRAAQALMGFTDLRQQFDIGAWSNRSAFRR